ncbi:MAG: LamG domain-containing protein [Actinobacteria bacterium]|nr:LamG domain-containing protein [Actinomycetota bacterium]
MRKGLFFAILVVASAVSASTASGGGPLVTAVDADGDAFVGKQMPLAFGLAHEAGTTVIRINVVWSNVVANERKPSPFRPDDPGDPAYDWRETDEKVNLAVANDLEPLITIVGAPRWAETGGPRPDRIGPFQVNSWRPNPADARAFARAVAFRYGGTFQGLPRVRNWEIWNEPNLIGFLSPQADAGKLVAPKLYRDLVNAMAQSIHGVHTDNLVAAGALAPFNLKTAGGVVATAPMQFMRDFLCMSGGAHPRATCADTATFDVWTHHPFTSGGPTHHAANPDNASLADLPRMRRLLDAAYQAGHIRSNQAPGFWVSEFAWDTRPPDTHPDAAPIALQARWVSEALYQSWKNGITLFTWFLLRDENLSSPYQDGLFFRNGEELKDARPKPTFYSFRFPFVAYREGKRISLWGRTPYGRPGNVAVQRRVGARWRWMGTFKTDRYGVFTGDVRYGKLPKPKAAPHPPAGSTRYRDVVVSASPMSYWPLDERSGSTASDVTKTNDGTYTGDVQLGVPGPMPGATAVSFNGKNARVRLGRITNVHSVELWMKTRSGADAVAFSNRNTNHEFVALGLVGRLAHSHDSYPIFADAVGNGRWHHIVYTYDTAASTGRVYVDGKLSQLAVWKRLEGGADASIAFDASLKSYFAGQIGQVAVYSYVLSPTQVKSHYEASGRRVAPDVAQGMIRAVEVGSRSASLPFSLFRPHDRYVLPFGGGGPG